MDEKSTRRLKPRDYWQRHRGTLPFYTLSRFLKGQKQAGYPPTNAQNAPLAARCLSSPIMAMLIDGDVQRILNEGRATASQLLTAHRTQLTKLARALLECEQLNRAELEAILEDK